MDSKQKVIWQADAFNMLLEIGEYLADKIGQKKANNFVIEINTKTNKLKDNPGIYPPCRFKRLQQNNFRCFRHKKYIVIYREEGVEIRIYGIIYERRNPKLFNDLAK